jgi:competence protein ComEC
MRLVYVALGWTIGLWLAAALSLPLWFWLGSAALSGGLLYYAWHQPRRVLYIALCAVWVGGWRYSLIPQSSDVARYNDQGGVQIEGVVTSEPDMRDDRVQLRVEAAYIYREGAWYATSGIVLVNAPRTTAATYGATILATGILITPPEFDTFSYRDYLARSGVYSVLQDALVEVTAQNDGFPLWQGLYTLKAHAQTAIAHHLPEPSAALLTGILLGNERGIPPDLNAAFQRVGAAHIIAISGFNMALISGVVMRLLQSTPLNKKWAAAGGIAFLVVYTLLVGASAGVVRAAIMSSLLIIAPLFERRTFVSASLALVLLLLTLHNPFALWDIGFQLSFLAVVGLALYAEPIGTRLEALLLAFFPRAWVSFGKVWLNEPLVASVAAQILTLPLLILYFQRLSLVALIVGVLILPVQAVLLYLGALATLIVAIVPPVAQVLYWLTLLPLNWTITIVREFARLPLADVAVTLDPRLLALWIGGLMSGAAIGAVRPAWFVRLSRALRRRAVFHTLIGSSAALGILLAIIVASRPDGKLHVYFLDVGHSNAVLLQTPQGAHILIDGGRLPSRLLSALGAILPFHDRTLEMLILTQPDLNDVSALATVLERYSVAVILTNGQPNNDPDFAALNTQMARSPQVTVTAGYQIQLSDEVWLEVLAPPTPPDLTTALNDAALVLRVRYGEVAFLLTGDVSAEAQTRLLAAVPDVTATVLQLPQHGTPNSLTAELLAAVQPSVLVAQIAQPNFRNDPDPQVLALLPPDRPLFRTDERGMLHFATDGDTLTLYTGR